MAQGHQNAEPTHFIPDGHVSLGIAWQRTGTNILYTPCRAKVKCIGELLEHVPY